MRSNVPNANFSELHVAHIRGESLFAISNRTTIPRATILRHWQSLGLTQRGVKDAAIVRAKNTPEDLRKARAAAANAAVRGMVRSVEELCKRAIFRERNPPQLKGSELAVREILTGEHDIIRERACGPYNIDFVINMSIAVECFGGQWHATGNHAARHNKRTRYLIDAGFDVIIVWVDDRRKSGWRQTLRDVITELKISSRKPASLSQYRVIWSTGEILYSGDSKNENFPFIPAFGSRRDSEGRYRRAR